MILNKQLKPLTFSKSILFGLVFVIAFFAIQAISSISASALSGSQFRPGNIMDDAIFYNSTAISPQQIQAFLNSKVPVCDTNGTQPFGGTTRAAYGASVGNPAPYTCLKDYTETIPTITNGGSDLCTNSIQGGLKSAASIIYEVSQACGINPQVLIVLIQKEQSLITDDWPWSRQYRSATGYGCPDSAPCDAEYYGFFNQVYQAAKAFRRYEANPGSYNYRAARNNFIYYHPSLGACGGSTVFIENQATANLYIYTPYQPNDAALNNLYGTGDGCSSYGNRNFWRIFNDWFGSTYADGYVAQFNGQSSYPPPSNAGQVREVYIRYKNLGSARWYDATSVPNGISPVRLAATSPINRASPFSYDWHSSGRPTNGFSAVYNSDGSTLATNQSVVEPNQVAEFRFNITIPYGIASGTYREHFQPVLEGAGNWAMSGNNTVWFDITVQPEYSASYAGQAPYPTMTQNGYVDYYFYYRNTGSAAWYDTTSVPSNSKPVNLATSNPINRWSSFSSTWVNKARPTKTFSAVYESDRRTLAANQSVVQPGQIAKFSFQLSVPLNTAPGLYREFFQPVVDGAQNWNMGGVGWVDIRVVQANYQATYNGQSPYPTLNKGQSTPSFVSYRNTGNTTWYDNSSVVSGIFPVRLAASNPINRVSVFSNGWPNAGRSNQTFSKVYESNGTTLSPNQSIVNPGQIAVYEFPLTAPWGVLSGRHREHFQPVLDGSFQWNMGGLSWFDITVN